VERKRYYLIAVLVILLDQVTKRLVLSYLTGGTVVPIIPEFFRLVRVENRGMAFGMFSDSSSSWSLYLLILISASAIGFLTTMIWKIDANERRLGVALALILGGAAGNLMDRLVYGHVIDFLDFYLTRYHWPAFNVADSVILIGAVALLLDLFAERPAAHLTT
jgi:signal peptidase II